jgi:hypothetical protein
MSILFSKVGLGDHSCPKLTVDNLAVVLEIDKGNIFPRIFYNFFLSLLQW